MQMQMLLESDVYGRCCPVVPFIHSFIHSIYVRLLYRFKDRPEFSDIALSYNYRSANMLVASLWALHSSWDISTTAVEDLMKFAKSSLYSDTRMHSALRGIDTLPEIEKVLHRNGTAQVEMEVRSVEWLEANGE